MMLLMIVMMTMILPTAALCILWAGRKELFKDAVYCGDFVVSFAMSRWTLFSEDCLTTVPQPLTKPFLQGVRSSASYFSFQYPLVSLRSSSSCLLLLPRLSITSSLPSIFPSITCFRRQFPRKMWPIQLAFLLFTICRIFLSSLTLCTASSYFHTIGSNWRSKYSNSTTFQNSPDISDILSEVSKFQHHAKLRSKYSTFPVHSLSLSPLWQLRGTWDGVMFKALHY